jgi:gliding motility-associated-like protein
VPLFTSSSNSVFFATRFRKEPVSTRIINVSTRLPGNNAIQLTIQKSSEEESSGMDIMRASQQGDFENIGKVIISDQARLVYTYTDATQTDQVYQYTIHSNGLCGHSEVCRDTVENMVLKVGGTDEETVLNWNPFTEWPSSPEGYMVLRATGDAMATLVFQQVGDVPVPPYNDNNLPDRTGNTGICYYVSAYNDTLRSTSNIACMSTELRIFTPNAFVPDGLNSKFRPEGTSIDYEHSTMIIYDRWGGVLQKFNNITIGWDGKDIRQEPVPAGVYFYSMTIRSVNGQDQKTTKGTVTVIR